MGKGYAEGPAADAAEEARDRLLEGPPPVRPALRLAIFGSTRDAATPHLLGWADQVDADELFASGTAWGISQRLIAAGSADR